MVVAKMKKKKGGYKTIYTFTKRIEDKQMIRIIKLIIIKVIMMTILVLIVIIIIMITIVIVIKQKLNSI